MSTSQPPPPPKPSQALAKQGDQVTGVDTHILLMPSPSGPVPTPTPLPFTGTLDTALSADIFVDGKAVATKDSVATSTPGHVPAGGPFQTPPTNQATVDAGSDTVFMDSKPAARNGDTAMTCNDPAPLRNGVIIATGTVYVG
jgi:uncharacterized Zn-binding protein involved in type VI secretion